ncbi:MAG: FtsH protease activity modulator HflK [Betaproteobacteria bacterium]|nr:FtsH protease activity modulator HflK [Betaproteobacteria bacterium]
MALNDPNWSRPGGPRGPHQGPPDLDELWRSFNRRLNDLFGRRRGGGGEEPPRPPSPARFGGGLGLLVGLIVAVWLATGFYIVVEGQRGVVLTFGKYSATTGPGLHWRMPWPIESTAIVNLSQVRTIEVGYRNNVSNKVLKESLMLTDDENIVDLEFAVQYIVNDPTAYLFDNQHPNEIAKEVAETAMREVIGKSRMDAILYESREEIAIKARQLMQQILSRYKTGIDVSQVTIQAAQPPEQVQAAFDDAVKAGQDRERQKNEGQAYANNVVPRARGTAARLLQEAQGYQQKVIANAQGDAARFDEVLAAYKKAPAVTRERMYLETMQDVLASNAKIMMDYKGGGNLLYLPLDKLLQNKAAVPLPEPGAAAPAPSGQAGTSPSASSSEPDLRSRDAFRSREREDRP